MQTAIFIVVVILLILVAYATAMINRILIRVDDILNTVSRIFNLIKP